ATDPPSPASEAGFEPGDRVVAWGNQEVSTCEEISSATRAGGEEPTDVAIERDGERLTLTVTPTLTQRPVVTDGQGEGDEVGKPVCAEFLFARGGPARELVRRPMSAVPGAVGEVVEGTVRIVLTLPARLVAIANEVYTDAERDPSVVLLVGVGRFAGE